MTDYAPHSFADDHGPYAYTRRVDWLGDPDTVPKWDSKIPAALKLDEEGDPEEDPRIQDFIDMLSTPTGTMHWHMFCLTAYEYQMRNGVERINSSKVVAEVNARGNSIFTIEGAIDLDAPAEVLIKNTYGTFMGRLFNYYHCHLLGRLPLFKLLSRKRREFKCGACGAVSGSNGFIISKPTEKIDPETWSLKDRLGDGGSNTTDGKNTI